MGKRSRLRSTTPSKRPQPKGSVFISAPFASPTETIERVLKDLGYSSVRSNVVDAAGTEVTVRRQVADSDLVVGVADERGLDPNVAFELGIAAALAKRTIIIAPAGVELPYAIEGVLRVTGTPANSAALRFSLEQLTSANPSRAGRRPHVSTQPLGSLAQQLLGQLRASPADEEALEEIVATAIRASGLMVELAPKRPGRFIDMVVWSEGVSPNLSGPLPVAVSAKGWDEWAHVHGRVAEQLAPYGSRWALYLYRTDVLVPPRADAISTPEGFLGTLLTMSIERLLQQMEMRSFVDVISEARNRFAHGLPTA